MLPSCQQNSLGYSWHSLSLFFFFFSVLFLFFLFFHFFTLTLVSFSCCHSHSVCFQALSLLLLSIVSIFFLCQPPLLIYYLPCSIFLACHPSPSTHSISFFKSRLIWSSSSWTAVITFMTQILLLTANYFMFHHPVSVQSVPYRV